MIDVCEERTRVTDPFSEVTLAKDDFINLLSQILNYTQRNNQMSKHITVLVKDAWNEMMEWIKYHNFDEKDTFDPKEISEYDMMAVSSLAR